MCAVKLRINNSIFMIQGLCIVLMLWLSLSEGFHYSSILYHSQILILRASIQPLWKLHSGFPSLSSVIGQSVIVPSLGTQSHLLDSIFISPWPARHQAHDMDPAFSLSPCALWGHHYHTLLQIQDLDLNKRRIQSCVGNINLYTKVGLKYCSTRFIHHHLNA